MPGEEDVVRLVIPVGNVFGIFIERLAGPLIDYETTKSCGLGHAFEDVPDKRLWQRSSCGIEPF